MRCREYFKKVIIRKDPNKFSTKTNSGLVEAGNPNPLFARRIKSTYPPSLIWKTPWYGIFHTFLKLPFYNVVN